MNIFNVYFWFYSDSINFKPSLHPYFYKKSINYKEKIITNRFFENMKKCIKKRLCES